MTLDTATRFRSLLAGVGIATLLATGICSGLQAQGTHTKMQATHSHARISTTQARTIALKKYPGKVEGKANLENEDGSWQYAVNIRSGKTLREVMVDAMTGKIANVEVTSKAEEAREQKAETAKMKSAHTGSKSQKPD